MRLDGAFLQMFAVLGSFEAPILRPSGTTRCIKKCSEKMMQKVSKNGFASQPGKTVPGAVGPLKQDNQTAQQWDIDPNTPWRA